MLLFLSQSIIPHHSGKGSDRVGEQRSGTQPKTHSAKHGMEKHGPPQSKRYIILFKYPTAYHNTAKHFSQKDSKRRITFKSLLSTSYKCKECDIDRVKVFGAGPVRPWSGIGMAGRSRSCLNLAGRGRSYPWRIKKDREREADRPSVEVEHMRSLTRKMLRPEQEHSIYKWITDEMVKRIKRGFEL